VTEPAPTNADSLADALEFVYRPSPMHAAGQADTADQVARSLDQVSALVGALDSSASAPVLSSLDNELIQVRLGIASSLFEALRCRHPATAAHALRVALACSNWAQHVGLDPRQRDRLELAALFHDLGKIGVPDHVLLKPGNLTADETAVMDRRLQIGIDILRAACADDEVLEIILHAHSWWDGSSVQEGLRGNDIPLGARMLAIADAFDAMTNDQLYRNSVPHERAFHELWRWAGKQFDPELVQQFHLAHECDPLKLHERAGRPWLAQFNTSHVNRYWQLRPASAPTSDATTRLLFEHRLLENLRDAVAFVDFNGQILYWNHAAERLTGMTAVSVYQHHWSPSLICLQDEGGLVSELACPLKKSLFDGEQKLGRYTVRGADGQFVAVEVHCIPVISTEGIHHGVTLVLHDCSPEESLEQLCLNLHQLATRDPLTQVANRAEFDRVFARFVAVHLERQRPCSVIVADIDHFKSVNDTYGHLAGDEVLKAFASQLKHACRAGDLVARYGGEEFVMLCADCEATVAIGRADQIRCNFAAVPQPALEGRAITASFGVTEIQAGDTPDTMFRRADRALFMAKNNGRNAVVQLGTGAVDPPPPHPEPVSGDETLSNGAVAHSLFSLNGPVELAAAKLRGFILDHEAKVLAVDGHRVELQVSQLGGGIQGRTQSMVPLLAHITMTDEPPRGHHLAIRRSRHTFVEVQVFRQSTRLRRRRDQDDAASRLISSLRAYLMAGDHGASSQPAPV
jgi:diguanylate cyclase (GGDEF)-like protein/PAS domain S-box-containing protein